MMCSEVIRCDYGILRYIQLLSADFNHAIMIMVNVITTFLLCACAAMFYYIHLLDTIG